MKELKVFFVDDPRQATVNGDYPSCVGSPICRSLFPSVGSALLRRGLFRLMRSPEHPAHGSLKKDVGWGRSLVLGEDLGMCGKTSKAFAVARPSPTEGLNEPFADIRAAAAAT